jgi:hypothetical protein
LTYLALSPRTPQLIARRGVELGVLLAAILGLVLTSTGLASHAVFSVLAVTVEAMGGAA